MGRRRLTEEHKKKIGEGVRRSHARGVEGFFVFRIETNKGIFFGTIEADTEEQAELRVKRAMERLGLTILNLEKRKRAPATGDNTFFMPSTGTKMFAGRGLWAAAGKEAEFDAAMGTDR